jgi:hypothetical protein
MADEEEKIDWIAGFLSSTIYSKAEIREIVRCEIKWKLPQQIKQPPSFGVKSENRAFAREIDDLAGKLLRKIETMPPGSRNALMILASKTGLEAWAPYDANSPAAKAFRGKLHKALTDLRTGCEDIISNDVGDDLKRDREKEVCAGCALDLIVGLDAGKPVNYDKNSPLRVLAGFLYDFDNPNPPDLKHQCAAAVAHWHQMPDAQRAYIDALRTEWENLTGIGPRKSEISR